MYKQSQYNYFVPNGERTIWFNGLSGQLFSLSEKENEFIGQQLKDPVSFSLVYPSVFQKFKDWGFVIDETADELDKIRLRNRQSVFGDRTYHLILNPTAECNFSCWYCYQEHPKMGGMTEETMDRIKKHIKLLIDKKEIVGINLSWFGGEPLLYFDEVIVSLASYIKELTKENNLTFSHSITTNGFLINEDRAKKMKELELNNFQITLDGDEKRHNKIRNANGQPSFATILNNISILCEEIPDVRILLRLNYDEQTLKRSNMEAVFASIPEKYRSKISPNFQRVWQTHKSKQRDENEAVIRLQNTCNNLGFRYNCISNAFKIGTGTTCYVDRYWYAQINFDGKIYKCTARPFTDDQVAGELKEDGEIVWKQDRMAAMYGKATFENPMCLKCKHLSICNGPCVQKMIETPPDQLENLCYLRFTEITPETFIKDLYDEKMRQLQEEVETEPVEN